MRMTPEERRESILKAAHTIALESGYMSINRRTVARKAGVSDSLVNKYFAGSDAICEAVMLIALKNHDVKILAEGLVHGHKVAKRAILRDVALKAQISAHLNLTS